HPCYHLLKGIPYLTANKRRVWHYVMYATLLARRKGRLRRILKMQNKSRLPLILILALIFIAGISIPVSGSKVYRVQPGDTAYQIARWHGVSLQNLLASNQLASAGYIIPRQVLFIPDPPTLADEDLYTVQAGDQLFSIA
ncbi:MAG TPA: hypothetical protein DD789_05130, partial [Firmicutes bacterium]|nr:hypothetical protein [Bacillota bacterium]